jgi:hypothetical protein
MISRVRRADAVPVRQPRLGSPKRNPRQLRGRARLVKPSMFIDDPRDLPTFCAEALRQAAILID